ncbi:MAPEG family protein [Bacteriovoracaceae bacterium]|nr:MAPEG family protein [Bacteriovoracaceae bacterium]
MISNLYLGLLTLLYVMITLETIKARQRNQISLGAGKTFEIEAIVSAHSNFNSYVPLLMILLFSAEWFMILPKFIIHLLGIMIFLGRTFHFIAFRGNKMNFKLRTIGMHMTIWPLMFLAITSIYAYAKSALNL